MSGVYANGKAYTVDVVIPTFNRPKELRRCLASLDDQTIMPTSVIVVDDSEDDNGPWPTEAPHTLSHTQKDKPKHSGAAGPSADGP